MTHSPHITSNPKIERLPKERFVAGFCCDEGNCPECLRAYREGLAFMRQERAARAQIASRKPRKTTLASALRQAAKVGKSVKGAEVYPDRVVLQFGEPTAEASANELDEWIANDARASERH